MEGTASDETIEDFIASFDASRALTTEALLKDSGVERTELVVNPQGERMIRKYLKTGLEGSGSHPYARLVGVSTPWLPKIYSAVPVGDYLVVLMEYLPGETLRQRVESEGPLTEIECLRALRGVAEGLAFLHTSMGEPLIHRDVNPGNIILTPDGGRLVDFGIARTWQKGSMQDTHVWGTAGYAAPEQFGFKQTDARTDIYGLGMTLRYALSGCDPNEPCELREPLRRLVDGATAFDPKDRCGSARVFLDGLVDAVFQKTEPQVQAQVQPQAQQVPLQPQPQATQVQQVQSPQVRSTYKKPSGGWRVWQVCAAFIAALFAYAGGVTTVEAAAAPDGHPIAAGFLTVFWFLVPWVITSDPFDILRRRGFYQGNWKRRVLIIFAICIVIVLAATGLESALFHN